MFFIIPIASFFYGALSWKDLLSYVWIIPITIVALFQEEMRKRLFTPKIELEFKLSGPYCLKTKVWVKTSPNSDVHEMPAYYFRFRVKNTGQMQAKLCECVIEELWLMEKNEWKQDLTFQPINLNWSNGKSRGEFLNVNPQCPGWFCDLVSVEKGHYYEVENPLPGKQRTELRTNLVFGYMQPFPNSQYYILKQNVRHRMRVAIYSENASPVKHIFEINWSGVWNDNVGEMFNEFQIEMS